MHYTSQWPYGLKYICLHFWRAPRGPRGSRGVKKCFWIHWTWIWRFGALIWSQNWTNFVKNHVFLRFFNLIQFRLHISAPKLQIQVQWMLAFWPPLGSWGCFNSGDTRVLRFATIILWQLCHPSFYKNVVQSQLCKLKAIKKYFCQY